MMAALLWAALTAAPGPRCSPHRLDACASTNQLVWSPGFDAALKAFAGAARGSYLNEDSPVAGQLLEALGGPPDDPRRLRDGSWLFTACRGHSCGEKGAVVLSPAGMILAAALLSYDCHRAPYGQPGCENGPTLTVFVPHLIGSADLPFMPALIAWGRDAAAADRKAGESVHAPFQAVPFQGVVTRGLLDEADELRRRPSAARSRKP